MTVISWRDVELRFQSQGRVGAESVVDAYCHAAPMAHPLAASTTVDVGFLAALFHMGGAALLGAHRIVVEEMHVPMAPRWRVDDDTLFLSTQSSDHAAIDALSVATGLVVERRKIRRALGEAVPANVELCARLLSIDLDDAVTSFGGGATFIDAMTAMMTSGVDDIGVHRVAAPPTPVAEIKIVDDGPLFICAGATERVVDVLSPFVRRLSDTFDTLGIDDDNDVRYAALPDVFSNDPGAFAERAVVERADGFSVAASTTVIRAAALKTGLVDARVVDSATLLAKSRATLIVVGRSTTELTRQIALHGTRCRAVIIFDEGLLPAGDIQTPDVVVTAHGTIHALANALTDAKDARENVVAIDAMSLGLARAPSRSATRDAPRDNTAAPSSAPRQVFMSTAAGQMIDATVRARVDGHLSRHVRVAVGVTNPVDEQSKSELARRVLQKMANTSPDRA